MLRFLFPREWVMIKYQSINTIRFCSWRLFPANVTHDWMMSAFALCLLAAAREISHPPTTWTKAWWMDPAVTEPGPHLQLICLAESTMTTSFVIQPLVWSMCPWEFHRQTPFLQRIPESFYKKKNPRDSFLITEILLVQRESQPCVLLVCSSLCSPPTLFKLTNGLCEVSNGHYALQSPIKIKLTAFGGS